MTDTMNNTKSDTVPEAKPLTSSSLLTYRAGSSQHRMFQVAGWACIVIPLLLAPYILPSFRVAQMAQSLGWAVVVLGLNMAIGWSGLLSLGHIAFAGLGGYTTTVLINESRWDFWMTLPVVVVACFIFGAMVGLPALKIRGLYLALVTLALAYTFPILTKIEGGGIARRTGGDNGRIFDERLQPTASMQSILGVKNSDQSTQIATFKYWIMLVLACAVFFLIRNVMQSRPGRAMIAIRDNQIGAAVSGVPLNKHKVLTFSVSAAVSGIGGSMIVATLDSVGPTLFDFNYAILILMGLVLGGVASLHGAFLAGFIVVFLQDFAPRLLGQLPGDINVVYARALFGLILIVVAFFAPGGIVSFAKKLKSRVITVIPNPPDMSGLAVADGAGVGRERAVSPA